MLKEEKQEIIRKAQKNDENDEKENPDAETEEAEQSQLTPKDKIAYIEKELGKDGYKIFLLHLATPDDLDTTPTETKMEQMRNLITENKISIDTIKTIIREIKNKNEDEEP